MSKVLLGAGCRAPRLSHVQFSTYVTMRRRGADAVQIARQLNVDAGLIDSLVERCSSKRGKSTAEAVPAGTVRLAPAFRSTAKAYGVMGRFFASDGTVLQRLLWFPRAVIEEGAVPRWMAQARIAEMASSLCDVAAVEGVVLDDPGTPLWRAAPETNDAPAVQS